MDQFCRADVLRLLHVSARQLAGWQRAGLVPTCDIFTWNDFLQVKKVRDLLAQRVRPGVIRQSLRAMVRQVAGMENPLLEASTYNVGSRVAFRHKGQSLEPIAGQFLMDFAPVGTVVSTAKVKPIAKFETVSELFSHGVRLEEHPNTHDEAIHTYMRVLELEPNHAAAHINLGTLYYNRQNFGACEQHYRQAVAADPRYALAYFDLGNVLDETGRIAEAVTAYKTAVRLAPTYADAHYNLALAYERLHQPRKALPHWRTYLKLDNAGPWAVHARNQIARILESDKLKIVFRRQ
jgi:tetratricopeptide (TPR) repeat protein